jgi:hypothetical protein
MQHGCNKKFFLFLQSSCIKETLALVQELLPTIMEISNASKGGAPEILQDIQLSNKNIVCFERDISHLQSELAELSGREIEFSHSGRPSEIVTALKSYFGTRCLQLHSLVADIIFLLTLFDKIASSDTFDGKDVMNKATSALLQQSEINEDIKSVINKIAVKLGTGSTMLGVITALVSMSGWIQYLNSTFTRWYYSEIQKLAEPEVMQIMKTAGQDGGSMYSKIGMYAFFIFFTIAVISLVAARMTQKPKNEADVVPGGLAKGLTLNDIAEKHGVSVDIMVAEFKKGIAVEMEHTTDREVAKEITLDHLFEDPKYYDKLKKVEEYVDKKGVEHVAAALPQTEEEPIKEGNNCGC